MAFAMVPEASSENSGPVTLDTLITPFHHIY